MKPIKFKEQNCIFAENQPEYTALPAHKVNDERGEVIFCMKLSLFERLRLLLTGKLWCSLLTFNNPLTPSFFTTKKSDLIRPDFAWFGLLNYYFLQLLFIRLTKHLDDHTGKHLYWSIQYWIKPFTGWSNDFVFIGKKSPTFLRIS